MAIDSADIKDCSLSSLRKQMGIVTQDNFLFSASIKENIRMGKPDASDEEIEAAAKKAFAHDFICALPGGYDTEVGERGIKLSGGRPSAVHGAACGYDFCHSKREGDRKRKPCEADSGWRVLQGAV